MIFVLFCESCSAVLFTAFQVTTLTITEIVSYFGFLEFETNFGMVRATRQLKKLDHWFYNSVQKCGKGILWVSLEPARTADTNTTTPTILPLLLLLLLLQHLLLILLLLILLLLPSYKKRMLKKNHYYCFCYCFSCCY